MAVDILLPINDYKLNSKPFSSLFTKFAPKKHNCYNIIEDNLESCKHLNKETLTVKQYTQFNFTNLPNEIILTIFSNLIDDTYTLKSLSIVNRKLRLLLISKLFKNIKINKPINLNNSNYISTYVKLVELLKFIHNVYIYEFYRNLDLTINFNKLQSFHNLAYVNYLSNEPLTDSTLKSIKSLKSLNILNLDVTLIQSDKYLPGNLKKLNISFRDDKDVHGNDPPDNMERYNESQIWSTMLIMTRLIQNNSLTLEDLNLKLLLPLNILSKCKWPNLKSISLVRLFPNEHFEMLLANIPNLNRLILHGRPRGSNWIRFKKINGESILKNLKTLILAACPIEKDNLFDHLPNDLNSFTIEDQISIRSSYYVLNGLKYKNIKELNLEPIQITLNWLYGLVTYLPNIEILNLKYSSLRIFENQSIDMFISVLKNLKDLKYLCLGWNLDKDYNDCYSFIKRYAMNKQNELFKKLLSFNVNNCINGLSEISSSSNNSTSDYENENEDYEEITTISEATYSPITFNDNDVYKPSLSLSTFIQDTKFYWNIRSNKRYTKFALDLSKHLPQLSELKVKRFNCEGFREEKVFKFKRNNNTGNYNNYEKLNNCNENIDLIDCGWRPEAPFPTTSIAFKAI